MCISFPGRVVAVDGSEATVEVDGRHRQASLVLVPAAAVGDRVVVHAGTILRILSPEAAAEVDRTLTSARASLDLHPTPAGRAS